MSLVCLFIATILSCNSCNQEELFIEPTSELVEETATPAEPETVAEDINTEIIDPATPCDFTLDTIQDGDTITINCMMDLGGQVITLPSNITILYEGGDIINGTLQFSNNNTIAGELLNASLTLGGTTPKLKDATFQFIPQRWGIVEGIVNDEVALNNRNILQTMIDQGKLMGVEVFEIDSLDAYFHFEYEFTNGSGLNDIGIHLPSNFHFKLSDNTHLRWQPNYFPRGYFLSVFEQDNVKITGGNYYGDRYEHDYSPIQDGDGISRDTHEFPTLITVSGSKNIVIDGVYLTDATGDAVMFSSTQHRINTTTGEINPNTKFNQNVKIINSTLNASRRNNISVVDGEDIYIENCIISNAGNGADIYDGSGNKVYSSAGVAPRSGIDIEPFRGWSGEVIFWFEKVERVTISGCTFINNKAPSILNYSGLDVVVQNNTSDNSFSGTYDFGTQYLNNTITARADKKDQAGINLVSVIKEINGVLTEFQRDSKVIGNTIIGFDRSVEVRGANPIIRGNTFSDFNLAIRLHQEASNVVIEDNIMSSSRETYSKGLSCVNLNIDSVIFKDNTIISPTKPLELINFNKGTQNNFVIDNCTFESAQGNSVEFKDSDNITVKNSVFTNSRISKTNCNNFIETNNIIN